MLAAHDRLRAVPTETARERMTGGGVGGPVLTCCMAHLESGKRFAIDAITALRLVRDEPDLGTRRLLVGPAVLRSHVLSMLYREVRDGSLGEKEARSQLEALATLKIRLLGDRVSRATAWKLARQLDWDDTAPAEYLAVAVLQADALVAGDQRIAAAAASGLVDLATYDELRR
jgi:predicted nucleic acid-binding protein